VRAGDIIAIPPFAGHMMVNTGPTWLVTSDDSPFGTTNTGENIHDSSSQPAHADYEPIKKMHGFAYYVVAKNGIPTLIKNPNYSVIPEAQITDYTK
jgi:oxalate decarboxylase/phosphoglucose isomerase-like protein (cupin superfamily)